MTESKSEIKRKIFHLIGLLAPFIYYFIPKYLAVILSFIIMAIVLFIDVYRHDNKIIQRLVDIFLSNFIREHEKKSRKLSGSGWMFIGIFLTCLLFSKNVAIFSLLVLFVSDAVAALVGVHYGKTSLINGKSLEGSAAFFISVILLGLFFDLNMRPAISFLGIIIAAIFSTYAELYSKTYGLDDNFTIPLTVGLTLSLF